MPPKVDLYFVFYFASGVVGSVMGHRRHLNDLKNTTLPVDLRPHVGREAKLFEATLFCISSYFAHFCPTTT